MTNVEYRTLFDLTGKTVLLTGGGGYLGGQFARGYAAHGADVVILDIDAETGSSVAAAVTKEYGGRSRALTCDISDTDAVAAAVGEAWRMFGKIDVLHNNAANQSAGLKAEFAPYEDFDLGDWQQVVGVDLQGVFVTTQAVGRLMVEAGVRGSILQTSSIYGSLGSDNRIYEGAMFRGQQICNPAVYSTVKAGSEGLVRWLATYWAEHGIRVNALVPGGVEAGQNENFKARYSARVPLGRMARAEEVVGAAVFLASDAASYITGQSLFVDGGLSAW
jgi:NAD(P)-dependent dehydrogenase (short-subunit alcohol dehydrogenase family)